MLHHGYYILSAEPLIVSCFGNNHDFRKLHGLVEQVSKDDDESYPPLPSWFRPKFVLEHVAGWAVPWHRMARFKYKQSYHFLCGRTHYLIVNAQDEEIVRKRFWINGARFSANIYVNENIYKPLNEPKLYDAIYTAQLLPFKRHWLAKDIEQLMVVSYGGDLPSFCPELKHADFNKEFLPRTELAKKYNQAYAGLCLSAVEGAMLAACEYLLSGIPIVSTPSQGGRDEFFNEQNAIIVPPESEAVVQAVQYWKTHPPDPNKLREQTLEYMNQLRREYCKFIAGLIQEAGGGVKNPDHLMEQYFGSSSGITSRFVKLENLWSINEDDFCLP